MNWITNIEKNIADKLANAFSKAKSVEETVVSKIEAVEQIVIKEEKDIFDKTREAALAANADVDKLKSALQDALSKSRDLHQAAIDAAAAAQAAAEADVVRFKELAVAHAADLAVQESQIVIPLLAPVSELSPVEEIATIVEGAPEVTTPVMEPSMAQQFAAAQADSTPT